MTQRGPASRSHRAHVRAIARSLTALLALSAAAAWAHVPTPAASARSAKLHHGSLAAQPMAAHAGHKSPSARSKEAARTKPSAPARTRSRAATTSVASRRRSAQPAVLKRASLARKTSRSPERALPASRPAAKATSARTPATGGELTADDFFRAAGASPEARTQTQTESDPQPEAQTDTLPADDATADQRVAALNHSSRQEMAEEAAAPVLLPGLYRNGRLVVPAPLKGSHDILVHQNLMADDEGLERVRNNDELNRLRAAHQLVAIPESASLRLNPELDADRRCARVWTVHFAADMARAFYDRFHEPLQVNSAVRTIAYQVRLQRTNGNAAGIGGEAASPHLTGQAIDIGKRGMSIAEIAWMRAYLKPLMDLGKVDVEEEFQQACFHISVYKSYLPPARRGSADIAQVHKPVVGSEISR